MSFKVCRILCPRQQALTLQIKSNAVSDSVRQLHELISGMRGAQGWKFQLREGPGGNQFPGEV